MVKIYFIGDKRNYFSKGIVVEVRKIVNLYE